MTTLTVTVSHGFTLIELLVVVLIIGILAAVALPQYTVAVERTRAMKLFSLMSDIAKAEEVYYLANGKYTPDLFALDIQPPAGGEIKDTALIFPDGSSIHLLTGSNFLAGATRYVQIDIFMENQRNYPAGMFCYAQGKNPTSLKICQTMGTPTGVYSKCGLLPGAPGCQQFVINR